MYHVQKLHHQKIQGRCCSTTHTDLHVIFRKWSAETPVLSICLLTFRFCLIFLVKQNRQKLILIPSFNSHKDLTEFISNHAALSGKKKKKMLSVHKRKWRDFIPYFEMQDMYLHWGWHMKTDQLTEEKPTVFVSVTFWELFTALSRLWHTCWKHHACSHCALEKRSQRRIPSHSPQCEIRRL